MKRLEDIDAQAQLCGMLCDLASGAIETCQIGLVEFNSGKSRICNCFQLGWQITWYRRGGDGQFRHVNSCRATTSFQIGNHRIAMPA